jgi:hypothetical protein
MVPESFSGSQIDVPSQWALPAGQSGTNAACLTASSATAQSPIPGCQDPPIDSAPNGTLRLTPATIFSDGGASYAGTVPSAQGLDIHFTSHQWGGRGADGILFYMAGSDPTHPVPPATLGPPGGHLVYAGGNQAPGGQGLAHGYIGIGLDAYGNFSNNQFDGAGCTDPLWMGNGVRIADQVTVRGPGSGLSGYCALGSTVAQGGLTGSLRGGSTAPRDASLVPVEIAVNPTAAVTSTPHIPSIPAYSYVVAISPLGGPTQYVSGGLPNASAVEPAAWLDSTTGIPFQLAMGFAASTGRWHDDHEIRNVTVEPLVANPAQISVQLTDDAGGSHVLGTPVTYTAAGSLSSSATPTPSGSSNNSPARSVP